MVQKPIITLIYWVGWPRKDFLVRFENIFSNLISKFKNDTVTPAQAK